MTKNWDARLKNLEDRAGLRERGSVFTFIKVSVMYRDYYMIFPERESPLHGHKAADWNPPATIWWSMWLDDDAYERVHAAHGRFVYSLSDEALRAEVREQLKDFHPDDHYGWGDKTMRQISEGWAAEKQKRKECRDTESEIALIACGVIHP
jgi:hypothetical protein